MYAHRPVVDHETFAIAEASAQALRVPTRLFIDASVEAASDDPFVAVNARRELDAWGDDSAVDLDDIASVLSPFASARPILVLASSSYRAEPDDGPVKRDGYGIPASQVDDARLADLVRGYLPIRTPRSQVTIVALRRGVPRLVALAGEWDQVPHTRKRYANQVLVPARRKWVDVHTQSSRAMSRDDVELCKAVSGLVVRPNGNRNAITWVKA